MSILLAFFLHSVGDKAFCAGGDVRTMYQMMHAASELKEPADDAAKKISSLTILLLSTAATI